MMKLPTFKSREEAKSYLEQFGTFEYFGRDGHRGDLYVYNFHQRDGRIIPLNIYEDGRVERRPNGPFL